MNENNRRKRVNETIEIKRTDPPPQEKPAVKRRTARGLLTLALFSALYALALLTLAYGPL